MRRSIVFLLGFCLILILSACGSTAQYELDGTWDYTVELTQSDFEDAEVGETFNGTFIITATETTVTFTDEEDLAGEGSIVTTRSGNKISYSDMETDEFGTARVVFEGTFTSPTSFSGTTLYTETFNDETLSETQVITMTKR